MPTEIPSTADLKYAIRSNRREFLHDAGIVGAGLAFEPWVAGFGANAAEQTSSNMIVHTTSPLNSEPQLGELAKSWITPVESFYVRSHAPNPKIDPAAFRLTVEGLIDKPLSISLAELSSSFEETSIRAQPYQACWRCALAGRSDRQCPLVGSTTLRRAEKSRPQGRSKARLVRRARRNLAR